jgi:hypothetical protein
MEKQNYTNDIKDLFSEEFLEGKKPTIKEFVNKYKDTIDVEEFIDWGLAFAMLHCNDKKEKMKINETDYSSNN